MVELITESFGKMHMDASLFDIYKYVSSRIKIQRVLIFFFEIFTCNHIIKADKATQHCRTSTVPQIIYTSMSVLQK